MNRFYGGFVVTYILEFYFFVFSRHFLLNVKLENRIPSVGRDVSILKRNILRISKIFSSDIGPVVGLILARGGSKGIRLKNLATINKVTLLARTIKIINETKVFDSIWVSTDHQGIEDEALLHNAFVHRRDASTATDTASSLSAVLDFLNSHPEINILGLIQVTSPFLKSEYLIEAVSMMSTRKYNSVFSVTRQFKLRWDNISGVLKPANFEAGNRPRRQDWNGELVENGMFYFAKASDIKKFNILQPQRVGVVIIPPEESLEIDSISDLKIAKFLLESHN